MLKHLLNQRATILSLVNSGTDRYNADIRTYEDLDGHTWACRVDPTSSQEMEVDRDTRRSWFRLFLTENAVGHIDAHAHVIVDDVTYEVYGEPQVFHARAIVSHVEALLRMIEG